MRSGVVGKNIIRLIIAGRIRDVAIGDARSSQFADGKECKTVVAFIASLICSYMTKYDS
jgi:hypothetical protein